MAKDSNKYQVYVEYNGKTEKAVFTIAKNDRVVPFKELPENEQEIYKAIMYNALVEICPELEQKEQEGEN